MAKVDTSTFVGFTTEFYFLRLVRIAPALVACLVITTLVSCMLITHAWLSDANRHTALMAFFGLSNLSLASPSNAYFSPKAEFNPFTHTWSLGVEEQFYLVFPILFYLYAKYRPKTRWRGLSLIVLAAACLSSIVVCAVGTKDWPTFAFYPASRRKT